MNHVTIRKNLVSKDNKMIQKGRFTLSAMENKAILYLISKISPNDDPGKLYTFNCSEFQAILNWSDNITRKKAHAMLKHLDEVAWWIDQEDKEIRIRWFDELRIDKKTGDIIFSFHKDILPFLLKLQDSKMKGNFFTSYKLENITLMRFRYSPRIYELLKSYSNCTVWTFENGTGSMYDLQRRIANTDSDGKPQVPKSWKNWAIFKRDVLDPAKEEINKYSDIKIDFQGKKEDLHHVKCRSIKTIEFYILEKTKTEKKIAEDIIDAEYIEVDTSQGRQMTLDDISIKERFFSSHEECLKEEAEMKEKEREEELEKNIAKSKHPALYSCLGGEYTEVQVCELYKLAVNNRCEGIPKHNLELLATDLITYYNDFIKAAPENTKTKPYNRLYDMVKNDYHNKLYELKFFYGEQK